MTRWRVTIEFDGTPFMGWQRQDHGPSVQQALEEAGGNLSQVVRLLGIGRTTLYRKLKSHRLRE